MAKKTVYIGQLDRRVTLVKYNATQSTTGAPVKTEEVVAIVWASIKDETGSEAIEGQVVSINTRNYIIRHRDDVVADGETMYVRDDGQEYNIHHVKQEGRKEYLVLKTSIRE